MIRRRVSFLLAGTLVWCGLAGCHCTNGDRARYVPPPRSAVGPCDSCAANGPMPPRYVPSTTPIVPAPPPPAVAPPPPGSLPAPPAQGAPFSSPGYAAPSAALQQNSYNPPGASTPSSPPGVYLNQPEPVAPAPPQAVPNSTPSPEPAKPMPNPPATPPETRPYTPQSPEPPPARDDHAASPAMPVDIPQFAMVKPNIASGLQPNPEGVPWLKSHGYRTVLHIRAPGVEDSAVRRRFEQSGLRYVSLEVSPQMLTKDTVEQFHRLIADANNLPLFVYDKDGSLAGALWYLHFRLIDKMTDEKAREDAENLGFKKDRSDAHLKMLLAVQNLLKDVQP